MTFSIDQKIISIQFGIGKIISEDDQFFIIEPKLSSSKVFVPKGKLDTIRPILEQDQLKKIIKDIDPKINIPDFESRKDRVTYYKDMATINDASKLIQAMNELFVIDDKGKVEEGILSNMMVNIALELEESFSLDQEQSKNILFSALTGENYEL